MRDWTSYTTEENRAFAQAWLDAHELVGMILRAAEELAREGGMTIRVVGPDRSQKLNKVLYRINVTLDREPLREEHFGHYSEDPEGIITGVEGIH